MPRNPDKKKCLKPRCRNYAMRGRDLCRSHLDNVLGPRGAGAPKGNLNAFKNGTATAHHINADMRRLAEEIVADPDDYHRAIVTAMIQRGHPTADPFKSLIMLEQFIHQLLPFVAENLFSIEVEEFVAVYPSHSQPTVRGLVWPLCHHYQPVDCLIKFREISKKYLANMQANKQKATS